MLYFFAAAAISSGVFGCGPSKTFFGTPEAKTQTIAYVNKPN